MKLDIGQLEFIDKDLRNIVVWIEEQTGFEFTGTSLYRIGDNGVHGQLPLRGVDLRMRNRKIGEAVEAEINKAWEYDPNRPNKKCAFLHGDGANLHIHLQTHPNTRARV